MTDWHGAFLELDFVGPGTLPVLGGALAVVGGGAGTAASPGLLVGSD